MEGNYIPTGKYCYKIGNFYTCTNDEKMASVYFGLRLLEKMGDSFWIDLMELNVKYQIWAKDNRMQENNSVKAALAIFEKARKMIPEDTDNHSSYQEIYDVAISAMPYLMKSEEDLRAMAACNGGNDSPARLLELRNEMKANDESEHYQWKNLKLIREAFDLILKYPDAVEGCYCNELEKVMLLDEILKYSMEGDCARLSLDIRQYIADFFAGADLSTRLKNNKLAEDNETRLKKRKMYLDGNVTAVEFCKAYDIELIFDEFLRSERWEAIAYRIYELVDESLGNPEKYGDNYYGMTMLAMRMTLNANNIDFKDEIQLNPESSYRRFVFEIDGNTVYTDYLDVYNAYVAIKDMLLKNDRFTECLEYAHGKILHWMQTLREENTLIPESEEAVAELVNVFEEALENLRNGDLDYDTTLETVMECVPLMNDFEHFIRYGYIPEDDDEQEIEED